MLERSKADVLVVGTECLTNLEGLLETEPSSLLILLPEIASEEIGDLAARFKRHRFVTRRHLESSDGQVVVPQEVTEDSVAYLLFTSGSTGDPKGVPVTHRNVRAYVDFAVDRYEIDCEDRVSQAFDLTFDLSVHDMFTAWERGACLYCIPEPIASTAARFIRDNRLTHWFSVPSAASIMSRMRLLRPGLFPSLRYSLFCGEALPAKILIAWQAAAPNSVIENLYGPTEATIAITSYRWDDVDARRRGRNGVVPIGWAFRGQRSRVVDENLEPVQPGQPGELLVGGSQITPGYWGSPEETRARYVTLGDRLTWYRTGDRVVEDNDGCLHYLGRLDDQVKIRGYRVELQEIDHTLREICDSDQVACIAWPVDNGIADSIVAFVSQPTNSSDEEIIRRCRESLPEHMVPRRIVFVADMPRNANGKVDRRKLRTQLENPGNNE